MAARLSLLDDHRGTRRVSNGVNSQVLARETLASPGQCGRKFRSSRLFCKSGRDSELKNIYAKPRFQFTGKGIVTKSESGYTFTLKRLRDRRQKSETSEKEGPDVHVGETSSTSLSSRERKVKVEMNDEELEANILHRAVVNVKSEMDSNDDGIGDDSEENGQAEARLGGSDHQAPYHFFNRKMFRRIGFPSSCVVECTLCYKQMKDTSMRQHFKTHSGIKPYPCPYCGARFTRKGDAYRHCQTIHRNGRPFKCKICDKSFAERKNLISHLQNHERTLYFACGTCGFKFGKKEYYDNHIKFIHPLLGNEIPSEGERTSMESGRLQLKSLLGEDHLLPTTSDRPIKVESSEDRDEDATDRLLDVGSSSAGEEKEDRERALFDDVSREESVDGGGLYDLTCDKGTLSFTERGGSGTRQEEEEEEDEEEEGEEELVNKAIHYAELQSAIALETILSSGVGSAAAPFPKTMPNKDADKADAPAIIINRKLGTKSREIRVNADFGDKLCRFIIHIPSGGGDIDPMTKEGVGTLINMANFVCSGKGELKGPIEIEIRQGA